MRNTLTISLPKRLRDEIDDIVDSGEYASASELIRDALRDLKDKQLIRALKASQRDARSGKVTKLTTLKALR